MTTAERWKLLSGLPIAAIDAIVEQHVEVVRKHVRSSRVRVVVLTEAVRQVLDELSPYDRAVMLALVMKALEGKPLND